MSNEAMNKIPAKLPQELRNLMNEDQLKTMDELDAEIEKARETLNNERKGYNSATLLGGLVGAAGVAITTRSIEAAVTGTVAAVAASYLTSETNREIQTLKDTGIGLASGATGAGLGFLGSKLLTHLLDSTGETETTDVPVTTTVTEEQ